MASQSEVSAENTLRVPAYHRAMSVDFPAFALSEEHEALRESVRALADDKIAPRAAEVDRTGEFPWDAYEALVKADLQAVHIPEAYGGAGADAIATAIVIEEVARACASSSLIPAMNKLGTVPLLLAASEEVKAAYLPPVARGEAMFSYALSEPEAGSDAAAMKTKAVRTDSGYVLNGVKRWITNAGVSKYYTHLDALAGHVTEFAKILTGRHGERLEAWIAAVDADDQPDLHSFTHGIRRDYDAVLNGLTLPWSSGAVEGNVNRLKMLKRQMYGRADPPGVRGNSGGSTGAGLDHRHVGGPRTSSHAETSSRARRDTGTERTSLPLQCRRLARRSRSCWSAPDDRSGRDRDRVAGAGSRRACWAVQVLDPGPGQQVHYGV
jgi:hypothetical protein